YLIDYNLGSNDDNGISNLMNGMISACRALKLSVSPAFVAEGFIVKEKGHFPNPTVEFEVLNVFGLKLKSGKGSNLNLSDVSKGIYFVRFQTKNGIVIKKLIY
ncbi:MAG: T9SS C-terminal target domain-containing protein, partial [Cytophagales bacterium]